LDVDDLDSSDSVSRNIEIFIRLFGSLLDQNISTFSPLENFVEKGTSNKSVGFVFDIFLERSIKYECFPELNQMLLFYPMLSPGS
jgi:hypothetical protein